MNLEEQQAYNVSMSRINKKKNETKNGDNEENISAFGVIGNSIMNGADLFMAKVDDIGSLATGLTLLPYEWLSGDKGGVTRYLEEQETYKKELQKNIKKRREEIDRYAENNIAVGVPLKVASSFIEQTVDPLQMGMNMATNGFFMNALQNTADYIYEEHLINDRKLNDFNAGDFANIGAGIAMAGITSKFQTDDIAKPLYEETFIPSLDKIIKENTENGNRSINRQAMADIVKRQESGQTLSLPKSFNNKEIVNKTIDEGIIPKLEEISKTIQKEGLGQKYLNKVSDENDLNIKSEISRIIKPLHTEITLGRKQALGEIADELSSWSIKNNKYDGISNLGDYLDTVIKDIDTEELVRMYQGKSKDPKYKDLQPILEKYIKEFVSIKSEQDLSYKENGFYLNTLYNKQHIMTKINSLETLEEIDGFIKGQMKDIGSKVFLTEKEALDVGLGKEGFYSINENPAELLKALYYDINATTKSVAKSNNKGDIGLKEKSMYDIALNWVDIENKEKYIELAKKKKLNDKEKVILKNFNEELLSKFENMFRGFEQDKRKVLENIISTIADERSGFNKVIDKLDNFSTAYKFNNEITKNIEWLDFTITSDMEKNLIKEVDGLKSLSAYNIVKAKNYDKLSADDKIVKGMKDLASWKLLFGIRHLREASPNTALVNTGAHKLGFDNRMSFIKGNFKMYKTHKNLLKNYDTLISRDLSSISDPIERMEVELFVRRLAENGYNYNKWNVGKGLDKLGKIAGAGQSVSDVHRIAMSLRFTSKAMFEEFPKMQFDKMTPEMRSVLKNNGINKENLVDLQNQILKFKNTDDFFSFVMNSDLQTGGKIKSLFEQFTDIMGREFDPYNKNLTQIDANNPITKLWINSNMLFKRYSMGAFSRAWETATSYYDSNDILRYRFIKNGNIHLGKSFNGFWKGAKHHSINLSKMSAGLWISTQAVKYVQGKVFGTADDEMIEAKYEALTSGDYLPIISEGIQDSLTDYIGYDVMFGGVPAVIGIVSQTKRALTRAFTSDELETEEKILYGIAHVLSPMNISRGIDNIKFGRNITTNLNSWSDDANYLWKHYYRKEALNEQEDGELPIEKGIKKVFENITDWGLYFNKYPEKAYEITNFPENIDENVVKTTASGVMELAERGMREDHIMYSFSLDDIAEREENLKEFGLDYKTQLMKLNPKTRDLFNYVMAFKNVQDPMYLIMALEEMVNSRNKIDKLHEFLNEDEIPYFDNFAKNIMRQEAKKKELARKGYQDNTEGYIEFLQALRNEI